MLGQATTGLKVFSHKMGTEWGGNAGAANSSASGAGR